MRADFANHSKIAKVKFIDVYKLANWGKVANWAIIKMILNVNLPKFLSLQLQGML